MRLVIFGVGRYLKNRYNILNKLFAKKEIVAFIDNKIRDDSFAWYDNKKVYPVKKILKIDFDYVVISSVFYSEMKEQLVRMGIEELKIIPFDECCKNRQKGIMNLCIANNETNKIRVLLVTIEMDYSGGSLAVIYAALAMDKNKYEVTITTPSIELELLNILRENNINIIVCPSLPYIDKTELYWMKTYDVALVNTFKNIKIVCELSNYVPTFWWIHECGKKYNDIYTMTKAYFYQYDNGKNFERTRIVAVTKFGKDIFEQYYPNSVAAIMPLGIPDKFDLLPQKKILKNKVIFAIIGSVCELKGHDVFIEAIKKLPHDIRSKAVFYIIGSYNEDDRYVKEIKEKAAQISNIVFTGVLSRKDIQAKFDEIDVVVCSSREETLSIAIIEGMMNKKICITTDLTGIAAFMKDGVNGFIVESDNAMELSGKMKYIIENISSLESIRDAARNIYEENFMMELLSDRLDIQIENTIRNYKTKINFSN